MCLTQKFSFSADPVILDLKLQLALSSQPENSFSRFLGVNFIEVFCAPYCAHAHKPGKLTFRARVFTQI